MTSYSKRDPALPPSREIVQAEALAWLDAHPAPAHASVITSLPDFSELPQLDFAGWRAWFIDAVRRVIRWMPAGGVAIFFQSDVRLHGALVDKGYLVMRAAEEEGAPLLWHKIVCRRPVGSIALGRPSYSHMIGVTKGAFDPPTRPGPDILPDAGHMPWSRAMGVSACRAACRYLLENTTTQLVVDPFCGRGTVLAVANAMGLDALGVDLSAKRCRAARSLTIAEPSGSSRPEELRSDALVGGARRFDAGAHFEAHEAWEEQWRRETDPLERRFFQGLVQVAAAFHKRFEMGAPEPAAHLLDKGLSKLADCQAQVAAAGLEGFLERARACAPGISDGSLERSAVPRMGL